MSRLFIDPRFRQERIFMIFTAPALLLGTALFLWFLGTQKAREAAAEPVRPPSVNAAPAQAPRF